MGFEELPRWWSHEGLGRGARSEKTWKFYALSAYLVLDISSQIIAYCIILYYIVLYCIILYYIVLYSLLYCIIAYWWEVKMLVSQLCPTLCDPWTVVPTPPHPPPGSSVHGILQARILEWVAIPFSRGSSQLKIQIQVSCIIGRFITIWATEINKLVI